jgi:PAS domain S-box-containing protein
MNGLTTEAILESISDGVFTIDADWRILSFNRAAEQILRIDRTQAIGLPCSEVFRSSMCERSCPLAETFKTGKPVIDRSGYIVDPSGRRIPVSVSTALLKDGDGRVIGGAETFRDLSELERLKKERPRQRFGDLATNSPAMQAVLDTLVAIASSSSTILISGETGTGKEVVAKMIHLESRRKDGPFVAVNCAALPETLLESELFGYRKGAFTGADRDKAGRFALAQGGTLFLDEIGDMPLGMQVKLLRVLQEQEYEPLGSVKPVSSDVRIICATNRDLQAKVADGSFRRDLYYRINVISMTLPPLRERREDLPMLAQEFLERFSVMAHKRIEGFHPQVFAAFYAYGWPGNIRELENAIERAVVMCGTDHIVLHDLPTEIQQAYPEGMESFAGNPIYLAKKHALEEVLQRNDGSVTATACELGLHRSTVYRMIKQLGIDG